MTHVVSELLVANATAGPGPPITPMALRDQRVDADVLEDVTPKYLLEVPLRDHTVAIHIK